MFTKSFLKSTTSLSKILQVRIVVSQVKTYMTSVAFQFSVEPLMTENVLPLTDEVMVDLVHKYIQQLHIWALHLEILEYFRRAR